MTTSNKLLFISVLLIGFLITRGIVIETPKVNAEPVKELPTLAFNPKSLDLKIDLTSGKAELQSNVNLTDIKVTANNPTKIVEKVVYKPGKERIKYETKTEYLEKVVTFPLQTPRFHAPSIQYPKTVER